MALKHPEPTAVPVEGDEAAPPPTPIPPTPLTQWVTLAVSPQDALVLKYSEEAGASMDLVLRPDGDTTRFSTQAVTLQYIFAEYGIEAPPKLPYGITPPVFSLRPGAAGEVVGVELNTEYDRVIPGSTTPPSAE